MNENEPKDVMQAEAKALKAIYQAKKKALGLTQERIALEGLGLTTQSAVSHYINGKIPLTARVAAVFASYLKVSVEDFSPRLAREIEELGASAGMSMQSPRQKRPMQMEFSYPVRDNPANQEPINRVTDDHVQWLSSPLDAGDLGFWTRLHGDAMISESGAGLPDGCLLLLSPTSLSPEAGAYYCFQLETGEIVIRTLHREAGEFYLKPLNRQYRMIPLSLGVKAIGRVVDGKIPIF